MKKVFALMLAACMLLSLAACTQATPAPAPAPAATDAPAPAPTDAPAAPEAPATPSEPAAPAEPVTLMLNVKNKAKAESDGAALLLTELYIYPEEAADKGANLLSAPHLNSSEYHDYIRIICKRPAAAEYEAYAVFDNGETGTFNNLELQSKNSLSFKGIYELSCKLDEDVSFTDEILAQFESEGIEAVEIATLAFEFKNKTGSDITAVYIYPVGAADKGSNILTETWGQEEENYIFPVVLRERAPLYEVYVEFADGTAPMTITDLNMDPAIKLSLKDNIGEEYSIDGWDDGDEEDQAEYMSKFNEDYVKPLQNAAVTYR